jgi:hypothetical protein
MVAANTNLFDMVLEADCRLCYKTYLIFLRREDYTSWMSGSGFVQDILPYLTAGERELLISNTCSDCFDKLFPPDVDNNA